MIGAGAMLLQCRPRTSAVSEVPSRISMKSYLIHKKGDITEVISCCTEMFCHKHPSQNNLNFQCTSSLMQQEEIKRGKEIKGEWWWGDKHRKIVMGLCNKLS